MYEAVLQELFQVQECISSEKLRMMQRESITYSVDATCPKQHNFNRIHVNVKYIFPLPDIYFVLCIIQIQFYHRYLFPQL
jgi:hypothetical protein